MPAEKPSQALLRTTLHTMIAFISVLGFVGTGFLWYGDWRVFSHNVNAHLEMPCHEKACEEIREIVHKLDTIQKLIIKSHNANLDGKRLPDTVNAYGDKTLKQHK